jgi:Uma2 family endonuclease
MATEPAQVEYDEYEEYGEERPRSPKETLPTMYDLPDEEVGQPGMPDIFHVWQARLLDETFRPPNYEREEMFTASDLNIYYDVHDFSRNKRPDWFAVVGLPKPEKPEMRLSYLIWQEGKAPLIVVELLSPSTEKEDLGQKLRDTSKPPSKWEVYEQWLRVPYYVTFSRYTDEMRIFALQRTRYEEVKDHQGRFWIEDVELGLGLWRGSYMGEDRLWLRWYDREGNWVLTPTEQERQRAEQEKERAEQERQRAEQERQRAEQEQREKEAALRRAQQLEAKLRELGIDPDRM